MTGGKGKGSWDELTEEGEGGRTGEESAGGELFSFPGTPTRIVTLEVPVTTGR